MIQVPKHLTRFQRLTKPMTRDEEKVWFERLAAGHPRAMERIVCANLKFACRVALQFTGKGVEEEDLKAAAAAGLLEAANRFNIASGYKFISYAVWWIRQRVFKEIVDTGKTWRIQPLTMELSVKMGHVRRQLEQRHGRPVTHEEVGEELKDKYRRALYGEFKKLPSPEMLVDAYSLDVIESDGIELAGADGSERTEESLEARDRRAYVRELMRNLEPDEREIVKAYFGLGDGVEWTLEELAQARGLTRERIRQIKAKAVGRMQHRANALKCAAERALAEAK